MRFAFCFVFRKNLPLYSTIFIIHNAFLQKHFEYVGQFV